MGLMIEQVRDQQPRRTPERGVIGLALLLEIGSKPCGPQGLDPIDEFLIEFGAALPQGREVIVATGIRCQPREQTAGEAVEPGLVAVEQMIQGAVDRLEERATILLAPRIVDAVRAENTTCRSSSGCRPPCGGRRRYRSSEGHCRQGCKRTDAIYIDRHLE